MNPQRRRPAGSQSRTGAAALSKPVLQQVGPVVTTKCSIRRGFVGEGENWEPEPVPLDEVPVGW